LHAKGIVHGRLCSRNVFLEPKIQLSLLDYAIGQPNYVYSSPQLLVNPDAPTRSDDIFAFGTLVYEIFTGHLPFVNGHTTRTDAEIVIQIQAGRIGRQLQVVFPVSGFSQGRLFAHFFEWSYSGCMTQKQGPNWDYQAQKGVKNWVVMP
jgi:hypothetical protein